MNASVSNAKEKEKVGRLSTLGKERKKNEFENIWLCVFVFSSYTRFKPRGSCLGKERRQIM